MEKSIIYSSFWLRHSKECNQFGDLRYSRPWHRVVDWLCIRSHLKILGNPVAISRLLPEAEKVCKKLKTHITSGCFRQVCSLAAILEHVYFAHSILIVGDGYGFMSCLCKRIFPKAKIVLIDIPEILKFQQKVISAEFYTIDKIDEIKGNFDIIINISSMQEMTVEMIDEYFKLFRRVALRGGLFYCCNRVKKELYGSEVIEFFKYPWKDDYKILLDEVPKFYDYYYSFFPPFKRHFDGAMWHRLIRF